MKSKDDPTYSEFFEHPDTQERLAAEATDGVRPPTFERVPPADPLRYLDRDGRVLLVDVEYRTMTVRGIRQEAAALRTQGQRLMDKARAMETYATSREAGE